MFLVPLSRPSSTLSRSLDRWFDDAAFDRFLAPVRNGNDTGAVASRHPTLDVTESDRGYTVKLDMPGVAKDDVKIHIDGRQVTVQAQAQRVEEQKDAGRVIYSERSSASYARSFTLPQELDQAESLAKIEHGVLTLTLAKRVANPAQSLTVN